MLIAQNLSFGYGQRIVIADFSCQIKEGEFLALLGPNGSGKTTLLQGLACILRPKQGHLFLDGTDLNSLSPKKRAHLIASVPQRPLLPRSMRVRDFVFLGRFSHLGFLGLAKKIDYTIVQEALKKTKTEEFADRSLGTLSGGEMQRVLLALTLAQKARILLLDEFSSACDIKSQIMLFDLLHTLTKEGHTVIAASHDQNLVRAYATRIVGLRDGRMLFDGDVEQAFTAENLSHLNDIPMQIIAQNGQSPRLAYPKKILELIRGEKSPPKP
ncbi:MAG: ABC transporter ATP-binding protein [Desulfovibrio sp.]|nr:ABC transporter ATP-binding protein [Desulfovibrio sp.]